MRSTSAAVRMPPDALMPMRASRQSRSSSTSSTVAPVRAQARRRLDEVDAGLLADVAGEPLQLLVKVAGLDDRLDDHLPAPGVDATHAHRAHDAGELVAHEPELAGEERRHVDDDVHLVGAALDRLVGGQSLDPRRVGAERERDDGARLDVRAAQQAGGQRDEVREQADGGEVVPAPPRRRAPRRRRSWRRRAAACGRWSWRVLRGARLDLRAAGNGQAEPRRV